MNTREKITLQESGSPDSPFDADEWERQERGRHAAQHHDDDGLDAIARDYRRVARAVRSRPRGAPPVDFAATVAGLATPREPGIERLLSRTLAATLVVVVGFVGVRHGASLWTAFQQGLGDEALGWALVGLGCVCLSWVGTRVRAFTEQTHVAHPSS